MSVEIKYKGNTIASASTDTTKTIKTSGKYCEADIEVVNTQDGGGGSLPSIISKIDGGSFTVASDTDARNYSISHNLGENPKGFVIWTDDLAYGTAESNIMIVNAMYKTVAYSATAVSSYLITRKVTSGTFEQYQNTVAASAESNWLTSTIFKIGIANYYKAGAAYKWIAWA